VFASILIDIHQLVRPTVTILDGIVAMDRDGPSNGRARNAGIIGIATDAFALDHCIERIVGLTAPLPITRKALEHNLVGEYEIQGDGMQVIKDFEMPKLVDTDWAMPAFVKKILKKIFVKKPRLKSELCKSCGVCCKVCPTEALAFFEEKPTFNYAKCIRCYCCQEMCPEGAITL
jgi:ferredoxin